MERAAGRRADEMLDRAIRARRELRSYAPYDAPVRNRRAPLRSRVRPLTQRPAGERAED